MACNLPAMIYSSPLKEEVLDLDFGECKKQVVRRPKRKSSFDSNNHTYSKWDSLPDILLEDIFSMLTMRERYYASQVCRNWYRIFNSRKIWATFIVEDRTLTRRKFNYYMGDQFVLDHYRTQLCFHKVARGFRHIIIKPMENFFNLYEFMTILSYFCENFEDLPLIRTLDFTFGVEFSAENIHDEDEVFGTGGKLLAALKRLMDNLTGLKHLSLQDLLLEEEEAKYLLDDVVYNCCDSLRTLKIVNCSKTPYSMLHPSAFVKLRRLTISPQHLSDDLVLLLANTCIRDLVLMQTSLTKDCATVHHRVWKEVIKLAPCLKVHHYLEGNVKADIAWQECAPVQSIVCNTPEKEVMQPCIFLASSMYCYTLEVLAFLGLPDYLLVDKFEDRLDSSLVLLSRCCPFVNTIVIRDRISSATLILIAQEAKNLKRLVMRRNSIIMKCDWPQSPDWSDLFYHWLRQTSGSYEKTLEEIGKCLATKWQPLSDDEFRTFTL